MKLKSEWRLFCAIVAGVIFDVPPAAMPLSNGFGCQMINPYFKLGSF